MNPLKNMLSKLFTKPVPDSRSAFRPNAPKNPCYGKIATQQSRAWHRRMKGTPWSNL